MSGHHHHDVSDMDKGIDPDPEYDSRNRSGYGGHEFAYESSTDLFRCVHCRAYEVSVRNSDGEISQCPGDVPGEPMVLNAW